MANYEERLRVRLLIPDTDEIFGPEDNAYMFSDEDIDDFIFLGNNNLKWAAGLAKRTVGGSEAIIGKIIKNYETTTNGATLMKEWEAAGVALIAEAKAEIDAGTESFFDVVFTDEDVLGHAEGYMHGSYEIGPYGARYN